MGRPAFKLSGLNGREYKMMLDPKKFVGRAEEAGARFWKRLEPTVFRFMDKPPEPAVFADAFEPVARPVRFRDTEGHLLDRYGYSLRVRGKDDAREITLKLRTPDMLVSALTRLPGSAPKAETKFEEDIAPLEVQKDGGVEVSTEPSFRSRFSHSTTQPYGITGGPATVGEAVKLFPKLEANLASLICRAVSVDAALRKGPKIEERVFKGEKLELLRGVPVKFALTLWYFDRSAKSTARTVPDVAEVSFKWEAPEAALSRTTLEAGAARTLALFLAMQEDFAGWRDKDHASKTKLALPPRKD